MRIIIAVTNDIETDQRILKVAHTFRNLGFDIDLVGRQLKKSNPLNLPFKIKRFKLWFNKQAWFYANYNIRLFFYLLFKKFDVVIANDLDTLPACFLAAKIRKKRIIYDSHEYFTEVPELTNTPFQRNFWLMIEKLFVPRLKFAYTVSSSIAEAYNQKYGVSFQVVRNLPIKNMHQEKFDKEAVRTIIYQGALNIGRGIELMIETMQFLDYYQLWIIGTGDIDDELKELANKYNVQSKVKFWGRVEGEFLKSLTPKAHIGLSLEEDKGLNYRYALPNKLFDYINASIPVIVSDLPEMRKIVNDYNIGKILKEREPNNLAKLIDQVVHDEISDNKYTSSITKAAQELCWENEQNTLVNIINLAIK